MEGDCWQGSQVLVQCDAFYEDDLSHWWVDARGALLCVAQGRGEEGDCGQGNQGLILLNFLSKDDLLTRGVGAEGTPLQAALKKELHQLLSMHFPTFSTGTMTPWGAYGKRS